MKRATLFIRMNDLMVEDVGIIPMAWRHDVSAVSRSLRSMALSPWDVNLWNLAYWYRETWGLTARGPKPLTLTLPRWERG